MTYKEIIKFWFEELSPDQHWVKDEALDQEIKRRFKEVHRQACLGELFGWRGSPEGRLAEIIVLDQFSRNIYRDQRESFAQDAQALCLAQEAVFHRIDQELDPEKRHFLYMPYMHSESVRIHEEALRLFSQKGLNPDFEIKHKKIVDRFGRYPHRNQILGRESTAEEVEFLKEPGSSF